MGNLPVWKWRYPLLLFVGQADITIDAKQRLAIPSKFRTRLTEDQLAAGWYCVPWPTGGILRLYPAETFAQVVSELGQSLIQSSDEDDLESVLFGMSEFLELDSSSRVRLPATHLGLIGLEETKDVTVIGAGNRLEIHDRETWAASFKDRFKKLPSLVASRKGQSPTAS